MTPGTGSGAASIHPVMVGTAGHIDHGKSSLVRALTGVDPDRLKEEKERGLTIDLGFAPLELRDGRRVGLVDVPGHERFVRNMVAGSTGLDLAVLVVAADDSVMPQTIEHLEILDLLGVRRGLVALTKVDIVDEEITMLAEDEVRELLIGTVLEGAEIVHVSSVTGRGIDDLRARLEKLAIDTPPRSHDGSFRMPVQRVFQLKGIGTVVTGVPVSGAVRVGQEVELLPVGRRSRVRAIQAYGGEVEEAIAGHSTALSVPDAKLKELSRGIVAAAPGVFASGHAVDVSLRVLARAPDLEHRTPIRFHTGTAESYGILSVLEGDAVRSGTEVVARVLLEDPVCCAHGDRFLIRLLNPVRTVGGGRVLRLLDAHGRYRRTRVAEQVRALVEAGSDPGARVLEVVRESGPAGRSAAEIGATMAIEVAAAEQLLRSQAEIHYHERGGRGFLIEVVDAGETQVLESVARMLRDKPLAASISRAALQTGRVLTAALKDAVLDRLQEQGRVRPGAQGRIMFIDRLKALPPAEQKHLDALVEHCEERGFRPPTEAELAAVIGAGGTDIGGGLLARAIDESRVDRVGDHVYGAKVIRRALVEIRDNCLRHGEILDIPELRDRLGTSRKYLIPLLEYVDGLGLTRLRGGERRLLPSSDIARELAGPGGEPASSAD